MVTSWSSSADARRYAALASTSDADETDGIDATEVAHGSDFSGSSKELSLDNVDLVPMVVAGSMKFSVDATGSPPPQDTTIQVYVAAKGYASPQEIGRAHV